MVLSLLVEVLVTGCVLSLSMQAFLDRVGVAWTFRIMGFIILAITMPAAMLLKERTRRATSSFEWCSIVIFVNIISSE